MIGISGVSLPFMPIGGLQELKKHSSLEEVAKSKSSFQEIFAKELEGVKFSAHAQSRLNSREINLTENDLQRLESAVSQAEQKGGIESLVLMDQKAFIVSVPNRTVITVVNQNDMESNVITNIDSAVFA